MEKDDQIFIQLDSNTEAIEYLLAEQPLGMIKGNFVTKDDIRQVVETGSSYDKDDEFVLMHPFFELNVVVTIIVKIDHILKIVLKVEKHVI